MALACLEDVREYLGVANLSEDASEQIAEKLFSLYRTIAREARDANDD